MKLFFPRSSPRPSGDARIDLPDQGSGHANVSDAAPDQRSGNRHHVEADPSSEPDQQPAPIQAM